MHLSAVAPRLGQLGERLADRLRRRGAQRHDALRLGPQVLVGKPVGHDAHAELRHLEWRIAGMRREHQGHADRGFGQRRRVVVERQLAQRHEAIAARHRHGVVRFAQRMQVPAAAGVIVFTPVPQTLADEFEGIARRARATVDDQAPALVEPVLGLCPDPRQRRGELRFERPGAREVQVLSFEIRAQQAGIEHRQHRAVPGVGAERQHVPRRPGIEARFEVLHEVQKRMRGCAVLTRLPFEQALRTIGGPPARGHEQVAGADRQRRFGARPEGNDGSAFGGGGAVVAGIDHRPATQ